MDKQTTMPEEKQKDHQHQWDKITGTRTKSRPWAGIRSHLERTCQICGLVERYDDGRYVFHGWFESPDSPAKQNINKQTTMSPEKQKELQEEFGHLLYDDNNVQALIPWIEAYKNEEVEKALDIEVNDKVVDELKELTQRFGIPIGNQTKYNTLEVLRKAYRLGSNREETEEDKIKIQTLYENLKTGRAF